MQEAFLYFIWKYQYFEKQDLTTTSGDSVEIFDPGFLHTDAGPDFSQCKIKIADITWSGHVEIHVRSASWYQHAHHEDKSYENVILHVVWENDQEVKRSDGTSIPMLELKDRVDIRLLNGYRNLVNQSYQIPCQNQYHLVNEITKMNMSDKALFSRLERKAEEVSSVYLSTNKNWEEVAYRLLCKNIGLKVNTDAFEQLSKSLPHRYIHKHANDLFQIEALLFGQAGFLDDPIEDLYYTKLQQEYDFLSKKYQLRSHKLSKHQWKFLRMRPSNFPTVRLAQLATVLSSLKNVFSTFVRVTSLRELKDQLSATPSKYWNTHYQFGKKSNQRLKPIGDASIDSLVINTVVPLLCSYSKIHGDQQYLDRAVGLLHQIKPESNKITKKWKQLKLPMKSAADSQSAIELFNEYCLKKKCLNCNVGIKLLTTQPL